MGYDYNYIDLFSGCGGLSLGLHNVGWKGLFAVEKSIDAFSTLKYNLVDNINHFDWPEWLPVDNHDIIEVLNKYAYEIKKLEGKVGLVVGGPPCQGFSLAGMRNENDERNQLVHSYIDFIEIVRPKLVLFENVKGFTMSFNKKSDKSKPYSAYVKEKLEALGYNVYAEILDFSDYGVPQRRNRFILVGSLGVEAEVFFKRLKENSKPFLKEKKLQNRVTLKEAISDLSRKNGEEQSPDTKNFKSGIYGKAESNYQRYLRLGNRYTGKIADSHRFANHQEETLTIFQNIINKAPKGKRIDGDTRQNYKLNRRGVFPLDENSICPTLTTNPDDYIHYSEPRILTVREYARIQSFPDYFEFKGKYTTGGKRRVLEVPRYTQIGNAIPPLFGEQAGIILKEMIT